MNLLARQDRRGSTPEVDTLNFFLVREVFEKFRDFPLESVNIRTDSERIELRREGELTIEALLAAEGDVEVGEQGGVGVN